MAAKNYSGHVLVCDRCGQSARFAQLPESTAYKCTCSCHKS